MAYAISVQLYERLTDEYMERMMGKILWAIEPYGFTAVQPHLYIGDDDLGKLYQAIDALQDIHLDAVWLNDHIASVKVFKIGGEINDFTQLIRDGIKKNYKARMEKRKLQEEAEVKPAKTVYIPVPSPEQKITVPSELDRALTPRPNWHAPRPYPKTQEEWLNHFSTFCKF